MFNNVILDSSKQQHIHTLSYTYDVTFLSSNVQWTVCKVSVLLSYWLINATNAVFLCDLIFHIINIFNCICCHAN